MREEKLPLRITVLKHTFLFNPKLNIVKKTSVCSVVYWCLCECVVPVVPSLHQFTQLVLGIPELFQALLVALVPGTRALQRGHLIGQLAGEVT